RLVGAVEALRASGDLSSENRQALFAQWVPAYKRLARLKLAAGDRARAFELAELSKARTLLESTAFRRAAQSTELSAPEQQRLQAYERQLGDLGDRMAATAGEERVVLETRKNDLVRELTRFRTELAGKYPKFARLSDVRILKAEDGRTALGDDVALISFLMVDDTPLLFTVTRRDGLTARELPKWSDLSAMIERYRAVLADPDAWRGLDSAGMRQSRELGERLLAPVANALRGKRHWIVSPDGALATLPFDMLLIDGKPVIMGHDVSYIQSLSMLALLLQRDAEYQRLDGRKTLFAMGGAQYEAPSGDAASRGARRGAPKGDVAAFVRRNTRDVRAIQRAYDLLDMQWPDLPGSEREVDAVAAVFPNQPTTVLKQADASEAKLLELNAKRELAGYRYLLFSTHGYLSTEEPALSAIVLSQRDKATNTDGYVTASEWPSYELRSDLIVLSACETALGKVVQGEGVMGLPYALYVAGNRNTLLSLWPVVDESTAAFMTRLFAQLGAGKSQVQALSDTKREFLAGGKYAAPVFWAPFVLYGS
ncbi:MAG: CHAT domain-containing protein, partial [Alphaproteobacteria bacterium]|nr:CHAT domain-containing protein [Alphaproteobacteria bacterium]